MTSISSWSPLGDKYYTKVKLYTPNHWSTINFNECLVSVAPCGGAIAICRDPTALSVAPGVGNGEVKIYSGSGEYMTTIYNQQDPSLIRAIGWTMDERLVVISSHGSICLYTTIGELVDSFHFPDNMVREGILHAVVWETGVAALAYSIDGTVNGGLFSSLEPEGRLFQELPSTQLISSPSCFSFLGHTSQGITFLVGPDTGSIATLSTLSYTTALDRTSHLGSIAPMVNSDVIEHCSVAPSSSMCAIVTRDSRLVVTNTEFSKFLLSVSLCDLLTIDSPVISVSWCGNHAVVISFEDGTVALVATHHGNPVFHLFDYFSSVGVSSECDGIRAFSANQIDFIARVPSFVEQAFRYGSVAPSSLLLEAYKSFESDKVDCEEMLRCISNEGLESAANDLIDSAGFETCPIRQKLLLRAAHFGLLFLPTRKQAVDSCKFVDTCAKLKVLNHLRSANHTGMNLTLTQFNQLSESILIKRLCFRKLFALANTVVQHLELGKEEAQHVLTSWAVHQVKEFSNKVAFITLSRYIREHINNKCPGISLAPIAKASFEFGHQELAIDLIQHEERPSLQVSCLLEMNREDLACEVACRCADVDLIYNVILTVMELDVGLNRQGRPLKLPNLLREFPLAAQLFGSLFKDIMMSQAGSRYNEETFVDFLSNFDLKESFLDQGQPEQAALFLVLKSFFQPELDERTHLLSSANVLLSSALPHLPASVKPTFDFNCKVIVDMVKLFTHSELLSGESTVSKAAQNHVRLHNSSACKTLTKLFDVNDKKFLWWRLRTYSQQNNWSSLSDLAFNVCRGKPAIGFVPFAEVCIQNQVLDEAVKYIQRIPDPIDRVEMFLRCKRYDSARQCLSSIKDVTRLENVKSRITAKDHKAHLLLDEMMGFTN
ncbi:hypothetical protein P9112_012149 [Eukaryota sp. TZLM1-RC]